MNEAEKQKTISKLKDFYKELRSYKNRQLRREETTFSEAQNRSLDALRLKLQREHGRLDDTISKYAGKTYVPIWGAKYEVFNYSLSSLEILFRGFDALDGAISQVNEAIGKLEATPLAELEPEKVNAAQSPKAFIAHEGETKSLDKLKAFLDALGVTYLIAEIEPSNGRLVEGQVDWSQGRADFVIILATKGKVVNKETGKPQIGTNVADELGRARQVFKNRIILLRQTGLEVHTNVSGIVRERFSPQSMDKAFIKIAKELKNWHLIRASKPEAEKSG